MSGIERFSPGRRCTPVSGASPGWSRPPSDSPFPIPESLKEGSLEMRGIVFVLLLCSTLSFAADRVVLVEDFTNSGCGYCWQFEPTLNSFVDTHLASGDISVCRVHVNWPSGSDPIYLANPTEQRARWTFYNVTGVPTIKVDGILSGYPNIQAAFNSRSAVPCHLDIHVARNPISGTTGEISIRMIAEQDLQAAATLRVFAILVEDNVPGAGLWAGSEFMQAFRDNLFGTAGSEVSFSAPYPDTVYASAQYSLNPDWNVNELRLVTFVQEYAGAPNKEVMNAHFADFLDLQTGIGECPSEEIEGAVMSVVNPSRGFLSIALELPSGSAGHLQVYDLGGRIVAERAVGCSSDIGIDLDTGMYLVRFSCDDGSVTTAQAVVMR